jgi:predicted exporter
VRGLFSHPRVRGAALFLAVAALWLAVLPHMRVDMSVAHFLPEGQDRRAAGLLRQLAESELASVTVIDVSGADEDALVAATQRLLVALRALPTTKDVRSGFDAGSEQATFELFSRVPPSAFLDRAALQDAAIDLRIAELKEELGGPMGPVVRLAASRDPLGATLGLLSLLRQEQGEATMSRDGVLLTRDGSHAFVFLTPKGDAFDADLQRASLAGIERAFQGSKVPGMSYETAGVGRFTIQSEEQIRGDIQRVGTLSTLGVLVLFGVVFRSLRMLLLGLVPLLFGTMVATLVSYVAFGSVHGLTLAFGTSLLGVGIDYAEHYYAHFALEPDVGAVPMMRRVWPGLVMGALTTVVGLAGLAWADFPGALQMAVFSSVAVLGALVGTRLLLPPWMPAHYRRPRALGRIEEGFARILSVLARFRRWHVVPLLVTAVVAIGLLRVSFHDDMAALLDLDPKLTAEDARVRGRLTESDPGRFAVVIGADEEAAEDALGRTHEELALAQGKGALTDFMPLGALLRSRAGQQASRDLAIEKLPVVRASLAAHGFRPEAFAPYEDALLHPAKDVMTLEDVLASPIGPLVAPLALTLGTRRAFVLPLGGVRDVAELRTLVPDALIVDEPSLLAETYGHVRARVTSLVALGLVFVFALLLVRYKKTKLAVAAMLPAILAAIATTAIFGWAGTRLNIFHAIGLALVLSMGVDYGIFVVEGRASRTDAARSLVSVLTATVTTILSFGMLAVSSNPALRSLGTSIALGMTLAFVLCPSALVWSLSDEQT